jgi:hypothetical protein
MIFGCAWFIGESGNYYLGNRSSRGGIRLNPVADYECNGADISDRIPLHGAAAFRCIQQSSRSLARLRNSANACGTVAVGSSPRATGPTEGPGDVLVVTARRGRVRLEPQHVVHQISSRLHEPELPAPIKGEVPSIEDLRKSLKSCARN